MVDIKLGTFDRIRLFLLGDLVPQAGRGMTYNGGTLHLSLWHGAVRLMPLTSVFGDDDTVFLGMMNLPLAILDLPDRFDRRMLNGSLTLHWQGSPITIKVLGDPIEICGPLTLLAWRASQRVQSLL